MESGCASLMFDTLIKVTITPATPVPPSSSSQEPGLPFSVSLHLREKVTSVPSFTFIFFFLFSPL